MRSGIGLAARRDVAVAHQAIGADGRPGRHQQAHQARQAPVLAVLEGLPVAAFELDADGEVVAAIPPVVAGNARVPGTFGERYELDELAVAANEHVGGHPQGGDLRERRMGVDVQAVAKQRLHVGRSECAFRQADTVDDDELGLAGCGTLIAVGRWQVAHTSQPRIAGIQDQIVGDVIQGLTPRAGRSL